MSIEAHIASLSAELESLGGSVSEESSSSEIRRFEYPVPSTADYRFVVYVYSDGEAQICAERVDGNRDEYFWHMPHELADYQSIADLHAEFLKHLRSLLMHASRIAQRKGWLFVTFDSEVALANSWQPIYAHSCFRFGRVAFPAVEGRRKTYSSPPVFAESGVGA